VVYSPVTAISYYAFRGGGAFKKDHQSDPSRLRVRALDWSAYCVLLGYYSTTPAARRTCEKQSGCTLRQLNSSIKFMHIADGLADFYPRWGKTSEWDTAASQCVLEEAGGLVLDLAGNSLHYNGRASLINPPFVAVGDQSDVDAILAWVLRCQ
jgi:3'(2'), 5'-bisphosphate nucleotidase